MEEQAEPTYQHGNYSKLAPELVDYAFKFHGWRKDRSELNMSVAYLAQDELKKAIEAKLAPIIEDQTFTASDKTIAQLTEIIESYGMQKDMKDLTEVLELRTKLAPGEKVLVGADLYDISGSRAPEFVIQKAEVDEQSRTLSLNRNLAWHAFGRLQGTDEVVAFPVDIDDALGAEAIKAKVYEWLRDTEHYDYNWFQPGEVVHNISLLSTFGDTEGIQAIRDAAARQALQVVERHNPTSSIRSIGSAFHLLSLVQPEAIEHLRDERAKQVATAQFSIDREDLTFYEGLASFNFDQANPDSDEDFEPTDALRLYLAEYERGKALIKAEELRVKIAHVLDA